MPDPLGRTEVNGQIPCYSCILVLLFQNYTVMYPRKAAIHLQGLCAAFAVVVVTWARQVGKTTLLRQVFPTLAYVMFDASLSGHHTLYQGP